MSYNVMHRSNFFVSTTRLLVLCLALVAASVAQSDRVTVPLSDPTRACSVKVNLLNGGIVVTAYDGKDVIVQAKVRNDDDSPKEARGMKRVPMNSTGLSVEEENNQVDIGTQSSQRTVDLTIQVPRRASLNLKTVNDGDISVTGVDGELDIDDVNGNVTLKNISGAAVAHALNGDLKVNFERINPQKAMAFSSLNGDVDVTFPADLKANVSMASDRGDVFSDFDIQLDARTPVQQPTSREKGGKYVVKVDKNVRGKINGGGQEIQFKNFNGNIYIRRAGNAAPATTPKAQ